MDFLKHIFLLGLIFALSACAKVGYMIDQGKGQLTLQTRARPNGEVLKDPRISSENKRKIKIVGEAKSYFYKYFNRRPTKIYEKTTMLSRPMVTTLVIASPFNKIEPKKECFPFVGCFPYLGFFEPEDAKEYAEKLESEEWVTYSRPVYAYSTLGHFDDAILSSFFHYSDEELVELVFHELFHTILFVDDEVDLNENLANYFGAEMMMEYFKWTPEQMKKAVRAKEVQDGLSRLIVVLTTELAQKYEKNNPANKKASEQLLEEFLKTQFKPQISSYCQKNELAQKSCWPLKRGWNNASFAAFLTYEKKAQRISELKHELNLDLKSLFALIERSLACYDKLSSNVKDELTFEQLLFEKRRELCPDT